MRTMWMHLQAESGPGPVGVRVRVSAASLSTVTLVTDITYASSWSSWYWLGRGERMILVNSGGPRSEAVAGGGPPWPSASRPQPFKFSSSYSSLQLLSSGYPNNDRNMTSGTHRRDRPPPGCWIRGSHGRRRAIRQTDSEQTPHFQVST